ncbi:hypothetical protein HYV73_01295 [Candidatus Uhrbacteria bacterium]|nr:hypothetical protein [Candidatus Uhrbacteria bacterium]
MAAVDVKAGVAGGTLGDGLAAVSEGGKGAEAGGEVGHKWESWQLAGELKTNILAASCWLPAASQ